MLRKISAWVGLLDEGLQVHRVVGYQWSPMQPNHTDETTGARRLLATAQCGARFAGGYPGAMQDHALGRYP